jgi:flagellar biosynthesis/type III secretory pathway protein FliH
VAATEFSFEALEAPVAAPTVTDDGAVLDPVVGMLARAEAEAEMVRAAAHAEGYEAGRAEALAALSPALEALQTAVAAGREERIAAADQLEVHAVELALFLSEKIVGGALAVEPERVVEAVRGALRGIVERERVTVLVHPADLELVREAMDELRATLGGIEHCEVQAERRVGRGGAIVRTQDGDVDARVETKLQRAREVVEAALGVTRPTSSAGTGETGRSA